MAVISFLTAILAGMGVGSAGLLVVYLTLFTQTEQLSAQLLNLIFFVSSSLAALAVNGKKKRLRASVIIPLAAAGTLGAIAGASFAHSVNTDLLGKAFGAMLLIFGGITLLSRR